jgi:hypothetical protein
VVLPIAIGILTHVSSLLYATLGALFLANTEGPPPTFIRPLFVACFTEAAAFAAGTLAATLGPIPSIILLGFGLFVIFLARGNPEWNGAATFTAISFAFGIGLPGASVEAAYFRAGFLLIGSLWGFTGFVLHRHLTKTKSIALPPPRSLSKQERLRNSLLLAIACSVGFSIGFLLGLPKDYWVVVTIVFTVRPSINLTTIFTAMMSLGTVAGALIAAVITIFAGSDLYVLLLVLLLAGFLLYSSKGVNFALTQLFVTLFIIVLLNIAFHGNWYLAFYRIADVGIGVGISLAMVEFLKSERIQLF